MMKINTNIAAAILIALYSLLFSLILLKFRTSDAAFNCLVAGAIMLLNFLAITWLWKIIFNKKSIALAVLIIIFKYLILAMILWKLSSWIVLDPVGLVVGFSSLLFAALTTTLLSQFFSTK